MASDPVCPDTGYKTSWPELVGGKGTVAAATIEKQNPLVHARIVSDGTVVLPVIECDRVWVWVDKQGIVYQVPFVG